MSQGPQGANIAGKTNAGGTISELHSTSRTGVIAGWSLLLIAGSVVYASPRWFFLTSDDVIWIRAVQSKPLPALVWEQFTAGSPWDYRPLKTFYFLWLQAMFGDWAPGYYASSLVLHTANALLVFFLARAFQVSWMPAALASFFFLVHPAPFRAVRWVIDCASLLQTHFLLWSLLLALRFLETERFRYHWASLACAGAAAYSKESGAVALVLPALLDFFQGGPMPLKRLGRYLPHALVLAIYVHLSLGFSPGWRSHPEVIGIGSHIPRNLAYSVGFAWLAPERVSPFLSVLLVILGLLSVAVVLWAFKDYRLGMFALAWLLLCALPTALFRMTGGLETTGRYTYFFLPPLLLAGSAWAERAGEGLCTSRRRWARPLFAGAILLLGLTAVWRTHRLAAAPFETQAGPALYHFAVMWLLNYREAEGYLLAEIGCPTLKELEEAAAWGDRLAISAKEPSLRLFGRVVSAIAKSSGGQTAVAEAELEHVGRLLEIGPPVDLVRGLSLRSDQIARLREHLANFRVLPVCSNKAPR
ncbi:MAG: hypothetical protein L0387_23610 [Acidobacteria bacterium]|nr:hypothetical protein [Acidobacteriota bacterium]